MAVAAKRECVRQLQSFGLSEWRALKRLAISVSVRATPPQGDTNVKLRERMMELACQHHRRHGDRMLHSRLRNDGWAINPAGASNDRFPSGSRCCSRADPTKCAACVKSR